MSASQHADLREKAVGTVNRNNCLLCSLHKEHGANAQGKGSAYFIRLVVRMSHLPNYRTDMD